MSLIFRIFSGFLKKFKSIAILSTYILLIFNHSAHAKFFKTGLLSPPIVDQIAAFYGPDYTISKKLSKEQREELQVLIDQKKFNINSVSKAHGSTALIYASQGDLGTVILLLQNRADVNMPNPRSLHTPLFFATYKGRTDIMGVLFTYRADVNLRDSSERTALMVAVEQGSVESVNLLLDRGARVDDVDRYRMSALCRAIFRGHTKIAQSLLAHHANANPSNRESPVSTDYLYKKIGRPSETPFMMARRNGKKEIAGLIAGKTSKLLSAIVQEKHADVKELLSGSLNLKVEMQEALKHGAPDIAAAIARAYVKYHPEGGLIVPSHSDLKESDAVRIPEFSGFEDALCAVCLESSGSAVGIDGRSDSTSVEMTACGHLFCETCLKDVLESSSGNKIAPCPSCRADIDCSNHVAIPIRAVSQRAYEISEHSAGEDFGAGDSGDPVLNGTSVHSAQAF